jgi:dTDP-4-dehydrorhamnose 3,5-epimerase
LRILSAGFDGLFILDVEPVYDERGMFARVFDEDVLRSKDLVCHFPQQSVAFNTRAGTVRGLHYQEGIAAEAKIVRVTRGAIFDVAVDIRRESLTFGKWFGMRLDGTSHRALYIPEGFAHGYQTLEDVTEVLYLISNRYDAAATRGVHYADRRIGINWPLPVTSLSGRDAALPALGD